MRVIKIPKELQGCVTLELFQQFLLGKTTEGTLTPGMKDSLRKISEYFFKEIDKVATENKTEPFFKKEDWILQAEFGFKYSMPPGNYVKIGDVIHLFVPIF